MVKFQKLIKKEEVYGFLVRLNNEYGLIWIQVLSKDPFPSIKQAYSFVQCEKKEKKRPCYTLVDRARMVVKFEEPKVTAYEECHILKSWSRNRDTTRFELSL